MTNLPRAQGDLTFVPLTELPKGVKQIKPTNGQYVLALGEATGHLHALMERPDVEVFTSGDGADIATAADVWIRNQAPITIEHTKGGTQTLDHDPLTLPAGVHRIQRQIEYSMQALRQVAD